MFRPPTKYSEYLQDVRKSIDYILKRVNATTVTKIVAGANVTISPADGTGVVTINSIGGGGGGLPAGGTAGQILAKIDSVNYNAEWIDNYALWTSTVKHEVKASESINKGQAVYVSTADGTNMIVSKASNTTEMTSSKTMGLLAQNLATNGKGFVVTEGLLSGLDTSGAAAGDPVWLGANGNLLFGIANKPYAPLHMVSIGIVTRVNSNNGEIFVKVQNGFELDELHNVDARFPNNNDGIFYNSTTMLWEHKPVSAVYATPTLAQVTTAGNTTTNAITVGGLTVATNLIYTDVVGGRVGIGTTGLLPGTLLTINGSVSISAGQSLTLDASANIYMVAASSHFRLYTGSIAALSVANTGNVLINTTTDAGYKLDVNGTARVSGDLYFGGTNNIIQINKRGGASASSYLTLLQDGNNRTFTFYQRASVFGVGVDVGMEVGAGFLNLPYYQFLVGALTTTSNAKIISTGSVTASTALAQGVYFNNTLVAAANNDVLVGLDINPTFTNGASTGVSNIGLRVKGNDVNGGSGYSLYAYGGQAFIKGNWSIDNGYNLIVQNRAGLDSLRVRGDGLTILEKLDVSDGANKGFTVSYSGVGGYQFGLAVTDAGVAFTNGAAASRPVSFSMNTGEILRIHQSYTAIVTNNFLVGTTTDAGYKLDVNGSTRVKGAGTTSATTAFDVQNSISSTTFSVRDDGRVLIPGYTLLQGLTQIGLVQFYPVLDGGYTTSSAGRVLRVDTSFNNTVSSTFAYQFGAFSLETGTASNINGTSIVTTLAPTSGSKTFTTLNVQSTINATGTYSGIVRGILYNPTLTSMTGVTHRAIETVTGNVIFGSTSGSVLIGTTSDAGYKLDVNGTTRVKGNVDITTSGGTNVLLAYSSYVQAWQTFYVSQSGGTHNFVVSNASSGGNAYFNNVNVGIGTTSPTYKLEVSSAGYTGFGIMSGANNNAEINFQNTGYSVPRWTIRATGTPNGSSGSLTFQRLANTFPLTITSGDNVLIGTSIDSGYKLDVNGDIRSTRVYANVIRDTNGNNIVSTSVLNITNTDTTLGTGTTNTLTLSTKSSTGIVYVPNGNVGIGIASPTDKLHIVDNTNGNKFGRISAGGSDASAAWVAQNDQVDNIVYRVFSSGVSGTQMGIALARSASLMANLGGSGKFLLGTYSNTDFVMGTGNAEKMRIVDSTGNVLIGTTTDAGNKLEVSGTASALDFKASGLAGWSGNINIPTMPPIVITVTGGIITNVM